MDLVQNLLFNQNVIDKANRLLIWRHTTITPLLLVFNVTFSECSALSSLPDLLVKESIQRYNEQDYVHTVLVVSVWEH